MNRLEPYRNSNPKASWEELVRNLPFHSLEVIRSASFFQLYLVVVYYYYYFLSI